MHRGYIKVWRKILDDEDIWDNKEPFTKRSAWIDLLLMAWAKEKNFLVGNISKHLQPGQIFTSIRYLAVRWRWSKTKVRDYLNLLSKTLAMITLEKSPDKTGTLIGIVNWHIYQGDTINNRTPTGTQKGHLKDTSRTPKGQNKECKRMLKNNSNNADCSKTEQSHPSKPSPKKTQNQWIEKVCSAWKDSFGEDIAPSAIQLLVWGRQIGDKVHGFKSYDALLQFISEMKGVTLTGNPFAYAKQVAKLEQGMGQYQKRAWQNKGMEKNLIGNILKEM